LLLAITLICLRKLRKRATNARRSQLAVTQNSFQIHLNQSQISNLSAINVMVFENGLMLEANPPRQIECTIKPDIAKNQCDFQVENVQGLQNANIEAELYEVNSPERKNANEQVESIAGDVEELAGQEENESYMLPHSMYFTPEEADGNLVIGRPADENAVLPEGIAISPPFRENGQGQLPGQVNPQNEGFFAGLDLDAIPYGNNPEGASPKNVHSEELTKDNNSNQEEATTKDNTNDCISRESITDENDTNEPTPNEDHTTAEQSHPECFSTIKQEQHMNQILSFANYCNNRTCRSSSDEFVTSCGQVMPIF